MSAGWNGCRPCPPSWTPRQEHAHRQRCYRAASTARAHRERHQATIGSGHRQRATNWLTIGIGEIGSCSRQRRSAAAGCPTSSLHTGVAMAVAVWVAESVHQRAVDLRLRQDKRHGPRVRRSNRGPQPGRRGALVVGDARAIKASAGPRGCTASGRYSVSRRRGAAADVLRMYMVREWRPLPLPFFLALAPERTPYTVPEWRPERLPP